MESPGKTLITQSSLLAGELIHKLSKNIGLSETHMDLTGVIMENSLCKEELMISELSQILEYRLLTSRPADRFWAITHHLLQKTTT